MNRDRLSIRFELEQVKRGIQQMLLLDQKKIEEEIIKYIDENLTIEKLTEYVEEEFNRELKVRIRLAIQQKLNTALTKDLIEQKAEELANKFIDRG